MSRERSTVTSTVDRRGLYRFWDTRGEVSTARFPRHDPDAIADDMKCIFQIDRKHQHLVEAARANSKVWWINSANIDAMEQKFLICLHKILAERKIKGVVKAVGIASRPSKKAWSFYTTAYQIYADQGILVKLIGVDVIEEDTWKRLYKWLRKPYPTT